MGIIEKIKEIEAEMARTQKNKATEYHLGQLKAKIAKLRTQLLEPPKGSSGAGDGFEVTKFGHGRVALIGFPSVGKSTLLTLLTGTHSEAASYEFTTLTCIPGIIHYKDTKIQLLDLPGIIEGASEGKGRGRQVIAVAKSSDIVLMVLDASKTLQYDVMVTLPISMPISANSSFSFYVAGDFVTLESEGHRQILTRELEAVGLRLNKRPPQIYFKKKKTGGISFNSTVTLTRVDEKLCYQILHEYKIHNAEVLFREDATVDDLIDVIEGNRKYMKCTYVYNKIDVIGVDDVDRLARQPHSIVISCNLKLNLDRLLARMWEEMGLVRICSKPQGQQPDFTDPVVLSVGRGGCTVEDFCNHIHRNLIKDVNFRCRVYNIFVAVVILFWIQIGRTPYKPFEVELLYQEKEDGGRGRFKSHSNATARISDREKKAPLKT
ncbi:UNVERIFIED_CONTAM: Developmentally-regulated G-protein 2 [Sesamum angustifolium]|uniref:Developmentally-regulated G-protein 2 n=1 Tax=Sesamum angustifolium TaxID=2727405 RepID=A0AAW2LJT1_9LAMI